MTDITTFIQFGGMGVMAFMIIAVVRIAGPILTALSDRLLDALERQTQTIDRLADIATSMDKRLIIVEQQIDMLQDLIHGVIWPIVQDPPIAPTALTPRPSRARKSGAGLTEIPMSDQDRPAVARRAAAKGR